MAVDQTAVVQLTFNADTGIGGIDFSDGAVIQVTRLYIKLTAGLPFTLVVCATADADGRIDGSGYVALLEIIALDSSLQRTQRTDLAVAVV